MVSSNSYIINAYKLKPMPEKIFKHWFSKFLVKLPNILNNNETAVWSFRSKDISSSWWCQTRPRLVFHPHSMKISSGFFDHTAIPHYNFKNPVLLYPQSYRAKAYLKTLLVYANKSRKIILWLMIQYDA